METEEVPEESATVVRFKKGIRR